MNQIFELDSSLLQEDVSYLNSIKKLLIQTLEEGVLQLISPFAKIPQIFFKKFDLSYELFFELDSFISQVYSLIINITIFFKLEENPENISEKLLKEIKEISIIIEKEFIKIANFLDIFEKENEKRNSDGKNIRDPVLWKFRTILSKLSQILTLMMEIDNSLVNQLNFEVCFVF